METALLAALAGVAALTLVLACVLAGVAVSGRRTRQALLEARAETETLHSRLDSLAEQVEESRLAAAAAPVVPPGDARTEYLITTAGTHEQPTVADKVVLSATVGEPLVKAVAFGYGVRRALAAQTRNRIAFEMRREVKRARKQRKRDLRAAQRTDREGQRSTGAAA